MDALPIAVVVAAYDRADTLPRALASAAAQTRRPAEVIVVDDASSDGTADVARELGATVLRHDANRGAAAARNTALAAVAHPWIAFLDADDEWLPGHLETVWRHRDGHVLVAGSALRVAGAGRAQHFYGVPGRVPRVLTGPAALVEENFVPMSATLVRSDAVRGVGGFDERHRRAQDLDLWLRVLERGSGVVLPDVGALYHLHAEQATADPRRMWAAHLAVVEPYAGRTWWPAHALEGWHVTQAWDEARGAQAAGDRTTAARRLAWIARSPRRLRRLAELLRRRRELRLRGGDYDHRGQPLRRRRA